LTPVSEQEAPPRTQEDQTQSGTAELEAQVADLEDRLRRALADLDNFRKRVVRDVDRERADERARVAAEWLPIVDHLEMALEHAHSKPAAIVDGVRGVLDQALAVMARLGFSRREDMGEAFDPARHQAVSTLADTDEPPGTVVHVVRPRYGQGDQQLRPASVVVATGGD
jgi:molecular chaperone GrpE